MTVVDSTLLPLMGRKEGDGGEPDTEFEPLLHAF